MMKRQSLEATGFGKYLKKTRKEQLYRPLEPLVVKTRRRTEIGLAM
jgi:hypothetical protein